MLWGCYVYVPVHTMGPPVGTRVSAELTSHGMDTLARYVGPNITSLHGDVVSAADSDVVLAMTSVTDRYGREQVWRREQVRVPRVAVQSFLQRRFSLSRSLLLGAAFLASSVAAWEAFRGGILGGSLPPGGGGAVPK